MYALPILLAATVLTSEDPVRARVASLPQACRTEESNGELRGLIVSNVQPLCAKYPPPQSGDYSLRYTFQWGTVRTLTEFQAHKGRLKIVHDNNGFDSPLSGSHLTTTMSAGAFRRALDHAGLAQLWDASDECPPNGLAFVHSAFGSTWEFYDDNGYRIRSGSLAQGCTTPFAPIEKEVRELIFDLKEKSRLVSKFTPEEPRDLYETEAE